MTFDPAGHHRRSLRLPTYDYSQPGGYFVTICAHNRRSIFGKTVDGNMRLNWLGEMVSDCWRDIPLHFPEVELDAFVVMSNHLHGVVVIRDLNERTWRGDGGRGTACCAPTVVPFGKMQRGSLSTIIRSFKSAAAKRINELRSTPGRRVWQRNYCEHVIRNREDLDEIRQYIADNPLKWEFDTENPVNERRSRQGKACLAPTCRCPSLATRILPP
jgi:REP element-mobilizing transposase RayT